MEVRSPPRTCGGSASASCSPGTPCGSLQDQYFAAVECQVPADDEAAAGLCRSLGMEQIDRGVRYRPGTAAAPADPKPGADTDEYPTTEDAG